MRLANGSRGVLPLLAFWMILGFGAPALAYVDDDDEETTEEGADEDEEKDRWIAISGGDVHDGHGGVLRGATVLAKNGKIEEIGYDLYLPDEAEVVDVSGYRVYPGLVAIESSGLFGGGSDLEDTADPFTQNMVLALASGLTSAVQSNQAAKLKRGELEGLVMNSNVFTTLSYKNSDPRGKVALEEKFVAAAGYERKYIQWLEDKKKDKELKEPSKKGIDANVLAVLRGDVWAKFNASARTDLLGIARLAQRFGFRPGDRRLRRGVDGRR